MVQPIVHPVSGESAEFPPHTVEWAEGSGSSVVETALDNLLDIVIANSADLTEGLSMQAVFEFDAGAESGTVFSFRGVPAENHGVDLEFEDGSAATVLPDWDKLEAERRDRPSSKADARPLDHPARLDEPITVDEYRLLEVLIERLAGVVDEAEPDEVIRHRIEGALGVLRGTHRALDVDVTPRREVVPVVKQVGGYLWKELPRDLMTWRGFFETANDMWPSVEGFIRSLPG